MVRVLVTGGAGFLGSHMVDRMLARPEVDEVHVVDNLWTGTPKNLEHVRNDERLFFYPHDIEQYMPAEKFDEIYHLASPASPKWYFQDPGRTISANVVGAMRCVTYFLKRQGYFFYTSSSEVYGDPRVSPQPEHYLGSVNCVGPRAAYDEGKRCTEAYIVNECRKLDIAYSIVRPFNVYGPRTREDDGRCVSNMVCQALRGQPITVYGDGLQTRSWGYVDDIVDGFMHIAESGYRGPINIGNDREISVLEVARFIARALNGRIVHLDSAPDDPTNRRPDQTLVQQVIPQWFAKPFVPYEEGVLRTIAHFKSKMIP